MKASISIRMTTGEFGAFLDTIQSVKALDKAFQLKPTNKIKVFLNLPVEEDLHIGPLSMRAVIKKKSVKLYILVDVHEDVIVNGLEAYSGLIGAIADITLSAGLSMKAAFEAAEKKGRKVKELYELHHG